MKMLRRFEIWIADLPLDEESHVQGGRRPVIIASNDIVNKYSSVITVIPLTSKIKRLDLPTHVLLHEDGLAVRSLALCEQVIAVDKRLLIWRIGSVQDPRSCDALNRALAIQFGMTAA